MPKIALDGTSLEVRVLQGAGIDKSLVCNQHRNDTLGRTEGYLQQGAENGGKGCILAANGAQKS